MRILQVNKFHYLRGGAEKYFLEITKRLAADGHEVAVFSMQHPKNLPSPWEKYFVSRISFNEATWRDRFLAPLRIWYSFEAKRKFKRLVKDFKPDIIHLHNIYHQISPSILSVARRYRIPVVMHLHDYKLICPNYQLFTENEICYRCEGQKYYQCLKHRCFKQSYLKSLLVTIEMYLHHRFWKIYERQVDAYIAPSKFMKDVCVRFGVPAAKIRVLYNFIEETEINYQPLAPLPGPAYLLYYGRLSAEKGINILLSALAATNNHQLLKIVGAGPELSNLEAQTKSLGLEGRVDFLGSRSGEDLKNLVAQAQAVIIPSVWLENMPFVLLESMAMGKVVVASRVGGLPELIKESVTGFLFPNKDVSALARILDDLDRFDLHRLGSAARESVKALQFSAHYVELLDIYQRLCATKN